MRLNKLEPSKRIKGRWLCHMEDGTILRVGEREVAAFALHSGMDLDENTRGRLESAAQTTKTRDKALDLLAVRPLSRKELTRKLAEREIPEAEAEEAADWLEGLGFLNDENYAQSLVRHYSAKGYGPYRLKEELYRRGVPKELWDGALAEVPEGTQAIDAFVRQKLKGTDPDRKELKRLSDALARRGYRWEEISAALRRYGGPDEDD